MFELFPCFHVLTMYISVCWYLQSQEEPLVSQYNKFLQVDAVEQRQNVLLISSNISLCLPWAVLAFIKISYCIASLVLTGLIGLIENCSWHCALEKGTVRLTAGPMAPSENLLITPTGVVQSTSWGEGVSSRGTWVDANLMKYRKRKCKVVHLSLGKVKCT